jgi:hypothetical protein
LSYNTFMLGSTSLIAFVVALLSMFALDTLRAGDLGDLAGSQAESRRPG